MCALTTTHALAAVLDGRPDDAVAPMDTAAEVAERFGATGDTDSLGFVHVPADVGVCRMWLALEANEPDQAVSIAGNVHPERHPFQGARAMYWLHYGGALAQLRSRWRRGSGFWRSAAAGTMLRFFGSWWGLAAR